MKFEHAGGYKTAANLNTYNARFYEGRWLAGWLAGKSSKSGVAGYVAGFPVPEVVQGINAFALGMQAANPKAMVPGTAMKLGGVPDAAERATVLDFLEKISPARPHDAAGD